MCPSIYDQIHDNIINNQLKDDFSLSEDSAIYSGLRFAPGARDGIYMYHTIHCPQDAEGTKQMIQALACASKGNVQEADILFASWTKEHRVISTIDDLQNYVIEHQQELDLDNIYDVALDLLLYSSHIECVKVGMALLEIFVPDDNVKDVIRHLGLYDEFTLFSVWHMQRWEHGNTDIFQLAQKVHGWGRIHAIECLKPETDDIRRWLLTEGTKNDVLNAYSARTCWEKANAEDVLFAQPTEEEYKALMTLIEALLDEAPMPGISALEHGPQILQRFLELSSQYQLTPKEHEVLLSVKEYADANEKQT